MSRDPRDVLPYINRLLNLAGIESYEDLAQEEPQSLYDKMHQAGERAGIAPAMPEPDWPVRLIDLARSVAPRYRLPEARESDYELLRAAGVTTYVALGKMDPERLHEALQMANRAFVIVDAVPDVDVVYRWTSTGRDVTDDLERIRSTFSPISPFLAGLPGRKHGPDIS